MSSTVQGSKVVAKNIALFTNGFLREVNSDMDQVRELMHNQIDKNISLGDHTLKDLARMGHPYSKRRPKRIHSPSWQVHEQSGELRRGLFSTTEPAEVRLGKLSAAAIAGIKDNIEHAAFVIFGTSKMVPRDFLNGSVEQIKGKAFDLLKRSLKHAVFTFRGQPLR